MSFQSFCRMCFLCFFGTIFFININAIFFYLILMVLNFEVLLKIGFYSNNKNKKWTAYFGLLFFVYILIVRSNALGFTDNIIYFLNAIEHLFFAIFVCVQIDIWLDVLKVCFSRLIFKTFVIVFVFNVLGFFNEYFQKSLQGDFSSVLSADSQKDLVVNAIGTIFYSIAICFLSKNGQKNLCLG